MKLYIPKRTRGRVYNKGRKIYAQFQYLGERIEYPTGDLDTPENRDHWEKWLDHVLEEIENGTFVYAEVFPDSKPEKLARFVKLEGRIKGIDPQLINLGDVICKFRDEIVPNFPSDSKRRDFESKIRSRILPYFEKKSLAQLTCTEVAKFIGSMTGKSNEIKK